MNDERRVMVDYSEVETRNIPAAGDPFAVATGPVQLTIYDAGIRFPEPSGRVYRPWPWAEDAIAAQLLDRVADELHQETLTPPALAVLSDPRVLAEVAPDLYDGGEDAEAARLLAVEDLEECFELCRP